MGNEAKGDWGKVPRVKQFVWKTGSYSKWALEEKEESQNR